MHDDAVRANTAFFSRLTGGRVMAVLKADAFGHGPVAHSVVEAGARSVGVTSIAEALALRADGVRVPVLSWLNPVDADVESALIGDVDLAVASAELLHEVRRAAHRTGRRARVHLHVDVGMNRDGCPVRDWAALCALARDAEAHGAIRVVGVMGHLSCAAQPDHPQNITERLVFDAAVRTARRRGLAPAVTHLAATAATIAGARAGAGAGAGARAGAGADGPSAGGDLYRIGAGLFGIDPSGTSDALRPALTLTTTVVGSRGVAAGHGVGYGLDHVTSRATRLALLPLGYADGLPRAASHRAEVFVRGRRRPLVGVFSMDMVVVDTGDEVVRPGEPVTVFGTGDDGEPTVADWAGWADTIPHEIVTRVGSRVARVHRRAAGATPRTGRDRPTTGGDT